MRIWLVCGHSYYEDRIETQPSNRNWVVGAHLMREAADRHCEELALWMRQNRDVCTWLRENPFSYDDYEMFWPRRPLLDPDLGHGLYNSSLQEYYVVHLDMAPEPMTDIQKIALCCLTGESDLPLLDRLISLREIWSGEPPAAPADGTIRERMEALKQRHIDITKKLNALDDQRCAEYEQARNTLIASCPHTNREALLRFASVDGGMLCRDCQAEIVANDNEGWTVVNEE